MVGIELQYVKEAFESDGVATMEPLLQRAEDKTCVYHSISKTVAFSSINAAIHLAHEVLEVAPQDFILVQSFIFCESVYAIIYTNAAPVVIDSEANTWNMCLEKWIDAHDYHKRKGELNRIKAILPIPFYGMPAMIENIDDSGINDETPIIKDTAKSLASYSQNKQTDTFGEIGLCSFNDNTISTALIADERVFNPTLYIEEVKFTSLQATEPLLLYKTHPMFSSSVSVSLFDIRGCSLLDTTLTKYKLEKNKIA